MKPSPATSSSRLVSATWGSKLRGGGCFLVTV